MSFFSFFRYRFAAVPGHFKRAEDPRLRPRASHKLFHNTSLLSKDCLKFQTVLNVWFGNEHQEWQLLYRASKDGFSAASFHTKCDGHSPTLTVVLVSNIWSAPIVEIIMLKKAHGIVFFLISMPFFFALNSRASHL